MAGELDPPDEDRGLTLMPHDLASLAQLTNSNGYAMSTCFHSMSKKWDTGEWPIRGGLERQAQQFDIPLSLLHAIILSIPALHQPVSRFDSAESGYR